jgi:CDP-diacylglycerol--serine O-phosphatidyltransferase
MKYTYQPKNVHQESKIYILPNTFTAGNLFFGFLAIILCIQGKFNADKAGESITKIAELITPSSATISNSTGYYLLAILCILASFFCDALDGRVARMSGKTSLFGKEFDSLADSVSFGIAPCMLMYFLVLQPLDGMKESYATLLKNTGWLIGFVYMLCATIRLARFNILTNPYIAGYEKYEHGDYFSGLPAPAAAGAVASIALTMLSLNLHGIIPILLIPLMLMIAWFMISNIPYPSFKHINWTTSMRFRSFVALIVGILLIVVMREYSFAIIFLLYIFYAPIKYLPRAVKILSYKAKKIRQKR